MISIHIIDLCLIVEEIQAFNFYGMFKILHARILIIPNFTGNSDTQENNSDNL